MTEDLRARAKVPYGYRIADGRACVDAEEAAALRLFFRRYLEGETMSAAAREARLPCSQATLPHLFQRKEYAGTAFYPAIITEEYRQRLVAEWQGRKRQKARRTLPTHPAKGVRVYRDFRLVKARAYDGTDPAGCAAALYRRIRPKAPNRAAGK